MGERRQSILQAFVVVLHEILTRARSGGHVTHEQVPATPPARLTDRAHTYASA